MTKCRRKVQAIHQPFEGRNPRGQFSKITMDMMSSLAWQTLTLRQQGLYLYLKAKYREKRQDGVVINSNKDDISMPEAEWRKKYGTYRTFANDLDKLEKHGFIWKVARSKYLGKPNIYGFSDAWKEWRGDEEKQT